MIGWFLFLVLFFGWFNNIFYVKRKINVQSPQRPISKQIVSLVYPDEQI